MGVFIFLISLIVLLPFILRNKKEEVKKRNYLIIVGVSFVLIAGLRHVDVGLDTIEYYYSFKYDIIGQFSKIVSESRFEPLFLCTTYLIKELTDSFTLLLVVVAATHIIGSFKVIHDCSSVVWLSCLLFLAFGFYYRDFNEIRQAMGVGISCLSFNYLVNKKPIKFFAVILIASGFHYSALIMLPMYLITRIRTLNLYWLFVIASLTVIMFALAALLFNFMNTILINQYEEDTATGGWGLFGLQIGTLALGYVFRDKLCRERYNICAYFMVAFSTILFPICHINPAWFRLEENCWIFMIILIPNLLKCLNVKAIRYCMIMGYVLIGLFLGFTRYYTVNNQIIPYKFYYEDYDTQNFDYNDYL